MADKPNGWEPISTAPRFGLFMICSPRSNYPMIVSGDLLHTRLQQEQDAVCGLPMRLGHYTHWHRLPALPTFTESENAVAATS